MEAGLSGAGAEQEAGHLEAPLGKELTMEEAELAAALATTAGAAAAEAASTEAMEVTEAEEAGVREEAAEVSDREAPSQGKFNTVKFLTEKCWNS